jgi:hypothetical protein
MLPFEDHEIPVFPIHGATAINHPFHKCRCQQTYIQRALTKG